MQVTARSRSRLGKASLFRDVIAKGGDSGEQGKPWTAWYAFACVAASAKHPDDALQDLNEAIRRGYKDADRLTSDDDLKNLRQNPHFEELADERKRLKLNRPQCPPPEP
jgi:hypothetical protein